MLHSTTTGRVSRFMATTSWRGLPDLSIRGTSKGAKGSVFQRRGA